MGQYCPLLASTGPLSARSGPHLAIIGMPRPGRVRSGPASNLADETLQQEGLNVSVS